MEVIDALISPASLRGGSAGLPLLGGFVALLFAANVGKLLAGSRSSVARQKAPILRTGLV